MFINELDAFCIVLPPNLCPFTCPDHLRYLAISGTEAQPFAHERIQYRAVGTGLPMEPPSALIRRICSERAIDTVGGMLRVEGLEISPESYLKRWRNRLAQPITPEQLALSKQLQAIAIFEWRHTEAIGDRKATWRDPPFATFGDLLAARGFPGVVESTLMSAKVSRLEIDLSANNGARDAWWADDWLSALSQGETVLTRRIEVRPAPPSSGSRTRSYNLRAAQALATM
jgi:hypothetical protein